MVGYFLLLQRPSGARDWGLAAAGLVLCLAAGSWVFGALLAQSVLLVAAHTVGAGTVASLKVLAAVTLFELAVQQSGRRLAARATTLALAVAVNRFEDLPGEILSVLYKMGIVAGLPLLLGAYVRVTRDAAVHARRHAEQQELRAEQQLLAARAAERTTIARELHDLVAHHVSSMVLRVGVARHVTAATGTTAPRITAVLDDLHASSRRGTDRPAAPGRRTASPASRGWTPYVASRFSASPKRAWPTRPSTAGPAHTPS